MEALSIVLNGTPLHRPGPLLQLEHLEGRTGLRLSGEIDVSNVGEFAAALQFTFRPTRDFHLDLAGLSYMDTTAVGLMAGTAATSTDGRRFVLWSPPPIVRTTLQVFGWDELPALYVVEGWVTR